jgi:tubulin polyglutamylase TTLL2
MADLSNPFCHLTNYSLNKWGPGYNEKKERIGPGMKNIYCFSDYIN